MNIIHLSDLHIGEKNNLEKFEKITNWIIDNKDTHKSNVIAITGDLTDSGTEAQYIEVSAFIAKLKDRGFNVLCVAGNHDLGSHGLLESEEAKSLYREYISAEQYPATKKIEKNYFIMLDSMQGEFLDDAILDIGAQGKIGATQIAKLIRKIEQIRQKNWGMPQNYKIIILLHHHLFYDAYLKSLALRDSDYLQAALSSKVDCVLFGHKHEQKRLVEAEKQLKIPIVFSSGKTTETMSLSVINLTNNAIDYFNVI